MGEASLKARFEAAAEKLRPRLFAESARWGAYWGENGTEGDACYGTKQWEAELKRVLDVYLPQRVVYFMNQLKENGLYPSIEPPVFLPGDGTGGTFAEVEGATIYYTMDGTDPRGEFEGGMSEGAIAYAPGKTITVGMGVPLMARALGDGGEWSALMVLEGTAPEEVWNEFLPTGNGENWDKAANWSERYYPNEPGARASIGVPTEFKKDKGWRDVHINKNDVTVGRVRVRSGGCTNRIDTGKSGNLTFDGGGTDAEFTTEDEEGPSSALIDLDLPNSVKLASDSVFTVKNREGHGHWADWGARGNGKGRVRS